jgi:hypothetical protein
MLSPVRRSSSLIGLLWQLAKSYRLGATVVVAGALVLTTARSGVTDTASHPCRLEQSWSIGDAYDNEDLDLDRRGNGLWIWNDRHGEQERAHFTWKRHGAELTITSGNESRKVQFSMKRERDTCVLQFDASPVGRASREFFGR